MSILALGRKHKKKENSQSKKGRKQKKEKFPIKRGRESKKRKKFPIKRGRESKKGRKEIKDRKKIEEICREVFRPDNI